MFQLTFGNYTFQKKEDFEFENGDFPDFAIAAIRFCHEWLSGENIFVQQTSGSTGVPKKIEISRVQMIASAKATQAFFKTNQNTSLLCCLDPSYIAGKMMLVRAIVWNSPIQITQPKSNPLVEITTVPDFLALVPIQVEASLQDKSALEKLKGIQHLIIGGAPLSSALKQQLVLSGINAYQTYGMTETVSHIALAKIESGELVYKILSETEFGLDERGAIWVKSAASNHEVLQTNDLVELIDRNSFRWLGRADFVINSGGLKLHPELLEAKAEHTVHSFFPSSAFFFFGKKDEELGEKLCLAIESKDSNKEKVNKLLETLKIELARFEAPKKIFIVSEFKKTSTGKISRSKTIEKL
ncbi:AMP-binding protein [Algoriphagus antarcticus]|uniref:O-succinylbenzoic acid--CoA ligase n=1 Tax=Algoriphagus antarcticus TaxID=238540 RepID=A0A3E0DLD9_9BACT|nr:AMP-binding protein [Algoriphagus antarcticus]REG83429.1 O-succinylbenzoic acid--CoA ligase [Algoriphagus antarcticus]